MAKIIPENYPELINWALENGIEMVDLKLVDLLGRWHHVTLPISNFSEKTFLKGTGVDGSSLGFKTVESGDMSLVPDPKTAFIDPFWDMKTLSLICSVMEADTQEGVALDPRSLAIRAEKYLMESGVADRSLWGPELEFHIFTHVEYLNTPQHCYSYFDCDEASWNSDKEGNLGYTIPYQKGYHAAPPEDVFFNLRAEMTKLIEEAGVPVKYHHHEVGSTGQCEVETRFMRLTEAGDAVLKMKYIIKNLAKSYGRSVTFMPKPIFNEAGNGMHFHQYLLGENTTPFYANGGYENLFRKENYFDLSETAMYYIGGILKHGRALLAFTNPSINSYKRLVPGFEAPTNLFFSLANRCAAIRIPKSATSPSNKRVEFRPSDATCNAYMAMAAMLMAGLDGIKNKIDPTDPKYGFGPFDDNIFNWNEEQKSVLTPVPTSLEEALKALEEDYEFLCEGGVFTKDLVEKWIKLKMREVDNFRTRPHPYEIELYYNV